MSRIFSGEVREEIELRIVTFPFISGGVKCGEKMHETGEDACQQGKSGR